MAYDFITHMLMSPSFYVKKGLFNRCKEEIRIKNLYICNYIILPHETWGGRSERLDFLAVQVHFEELVTVSLLLDFEAVGLQLGAFDSIVALLRSFEAIVVLLPTAVETKATFGLLPSALSSVITTTSNVKQLGGSNH